MTDSGLPMDKIGKYQIVEKIGVGGFGEVYKALDPFIKRHVAVKTCNAEDQETRNRFFQEAEIAGKLSHRNVTTVYDFGIEDTLPYLIQEYLSGEDLDRKIKRREYLPFAEKLYYLIQIARGMAYAHQQGVIHRDIKPANIRILEDGTAKIMDFGIAKLAHQETGLTRTGMTVGTAAYLAPEQIRGEPVDLRTDVFSFGVLAYELLTYERPFQGEQISAVIYQILNREPKPIRELWPGVPPDVEELVNRCLAKDADDRFADGAAVLRHLEALQKQGPEGAATGAAPAVDAQARTRQVARPRAAPAPPPADVLTAATARRGLADVELSSVSLDDSRARVSGGRRGGRRRRSAYAAVLIPIAVLAVAAGLWLGSPELRQQVLDLLGGAPPPAADQAAGGEEEPADEEGPPAGEEEGAPAEASTAEPPVPEPEAEPPAAPPEEPPAEPPPPPPPPPEPGTLVVPRVAWSDAMFVIVDRGQAYPLNKERPFSLPPGTHRVTFSLREPDYETSKTVTVEIREGGRQTVEVPIAQPGVLTVIASPGLPQGRIFLGDEDLGRSPLRRRKLAPGEYPLLVSPLAGSGPSAEKAIRIYPGQETFILFDLNAGDMTGEVKPLD